MSKFYITFGQSHAHSVNGKTFDKDCVAEIEAETNNEAHSIAMDVFNGVFHQCLTKEQTVHNMHYFPRGIIKL